MLDEALKYKDKKEHPHMFHRNDRVMANNILASYCLMASQQERDNDKQQKLLAQGRDYIA